MDSITTQLSREAPHTRRLADAYSGAPLDLVKLVAAGLMLVDHVNYLFGDASPNLMWLLGRAAFPLFVFALACNLMRGTKLARYVQILILLGAVSQPIFATTTSIVQGNIIFTLAVGAVVAAAMRTQRPMTQHLIFAAGIACILSPFVQARYGLDYGVAGILLPAALLCVLEGKWWHTIWLVLLVFALNWYPSEGWKLHPIEAACFAGGLSSAVALAALALRNRPRFLPRYALHVFYPGHLLVLMIIHYRV
jgi:hypothetical protein